MDFTGARRDLVRVTRRNAVTNCHYPFTLIAQFARVVVVCSCSSVVLSVAVVHPGSVHVGMCVGMSRCRVLDCFCWDRNSTFEVGEDKSWWPSPKRASRLIRASHVVCSFCISERTRFFEIQM